MPCQAIFVAAEYRILCSIARCPYPPRVDLDLDPQPAYLTIMHCGYRSACRAPRCTHTATTILRKSDRAGRFLRQIELCDGHGTATMQRETAKGLPVVDWRVRD